MTTRKPTTPPTTPPAILPASSSSPLLPPPGAGSSGSSPMPESSGSGAGSMPGAGVMSSPPTSPTEILPARGELSGSANSSLGDESTTRCLKALNCSSVRSSARPAVMVVFTEPLVRSPISTHGTQGSDALTGLPMSVGLRLYSPAARASRMVVLNSSSEVVLPVMSSKSMSTETSIMRFHFWPGYRLDDSPSSLPASLIASTKPWVSSPSTSVSLADTCMLSTRTPSCVSSCPLFTLSLKLASIFENAEGLIGEGPVMFVDGGSMSRPSVMLLFRGGSTLGP
mmetsp:Transcript_25574/g.69424  ORF Transcript_25574/g.69424 Transcript_25574/m.69424 type:complete len:283 (-) Transcript_25574:76-924(-)